MNSTNMQFDPNSFLSQLSELFPASDPKVVQYITNAFSRQVPPGIGANLSQVNTVMSTQPILNSVAPLQQQNSQVKFHEEKTSSIFECLSTCTISNISKISTSSSISSITDDRKETFEDDNVSDLTNSLESASVLTNQKIDTGQFDQDKNILDRSRKIKKDSFHSNGTNHRLEREEKVPKARSRKGLWTEEEDTLMRELVAQLGPKWAQIANMIGGKNGKQVRDRYTNISRPDINYAKWTKEEDQLFVSLLDKYGRKWCQIAAEMPGRTESQVKSKFYCLKRNKDNDDLRKKKLRQAVENVEQGKTGKQLENQSSDISRANFQDEIDAYFEFNKNQEMVEIPNKEYNEVDYFL